ncbi:MAG TPA: molybdopterin-binding protein [Anaerolineales bacterium]
MIIELIVIGSELTAGAIVDTNTQTIARMIREAGFDVQRVTVVGDNLEQIAAAVREAANRADAVITTGGLGPTVDDPTREAMARAAGVELIFHPELWETIRARFARLNRPISENNRQQAFLPAGAEALPNPCGSAPGISMEIGRALLCAVPGVPGEMKAMIREQVLPLLARRGGGEIIRTRTIHVVGLGESQIDDRIGRWEHAENPVAGLAAHAGVTDVRLTGRGADEAGAWAAIAAAEKDIRSALEGHILGIDGETLAGQVLRCLPTGATLATVECGTGGVLGGVLSREGSEFFCGGLVLTGTDREREDFPAVVGQWRIERQVTHAVGLTLQQDADGFRSEGMLLIGESARQIRQRFLVAQEIAIEASVNTALIELWKALKQFPSG